MIMIKKFMKNMNDLNFVEYLENLFVQKIQKPSNDQWNIFNFYQNFLIQFRKNFKYLSREILNKSTSWLFPVLNQVLNIEHVLLEKSKMLCKKSRNVSNTKYHRSTIVDWTRCETSSDRFVIFVQQ